MKKMFTFIFILLLPLSFPAFSDTAQATGQTLMMATTTSTDNTGLLDALAPMFKADTGIELKWTAVGTGKALKMGENCDVDVLLVHAPASERNYVEQGFGVDREQVMYNDFVIIGPPDDPARVKGLHVDTALKTISSVRSVFASRGDNSGTNKKEISLWKAAGMAVPDKEDWYVQTGQGMIATINVAAEKDGYTMTDRGTFIKYAHNHSGNPPLVVLVEGDEVLFNQYSVLAVNPARCKNVQYGLASKFADWITSPKIQKVIGEFKLLGKPLFIPNAGE
ncbi:MAG: substrate-binding domain-containing protein [Thermodesulfobacteriota bacterium]|nr:substrate-binding domain-containing protein [Thermodesulfobacteriota bacterium]